MFRRASLVFAVGIILILSLSINYNPEIAFLEIDSKGLTLDIEMLESVINCRNKRFFSYSTKQGLQRIQATRLVSSAKLKKRYPKTLVLEYTARQPLAWIGDYHNMAFDENRVVFPVEPYFPPLDLPEIYFGLDKLPEDRLDENLYDLAKQFLDEFSFKPFRVSIVDLRGFAKEQFGQKEIAVHVVEGKKKWLLRLLVENWKSQLELFFKNKEFLQTQVDPECDQYLVDLRLDQLAYISDLNTHSSN